MAIGKRIFRALATLMNAVALGDTAESFSSVVDMKTDGYLASEVDVNVTFHASGTQNVLICCYARLNSSFDGSEIPFFSQEIAVGAGSTRRLPIAIPDKLYWRIGARHVASDTNHAVVTITEQSWRYDIS